MFGTELDVRAVHLAPGSAPAAGAPVSGGPRPVAKAQPKRAQTYARPSVQNQTAATSPALSRSSRSNLRHASRNRNPEPPRADEDIPEEEQAEMVADAHSGLDRHHDQGAVALDLLKTELGATVIEWGLEVGRQVSKVTGPFVTLATSSLRPQGSRCGRDCAS